MRLLMIVVYILTLVFFYACGKQAKLKDASYLTLRMNLSGDICTSHIDMKRMVKILVVADTSASNGGVGGQPGLGTDPIQNNTTKRLEAFRELMSTFVPSPENYDANKASNYSFGLITFNGDATSWLRDSNGGLFMTPKFIGDTEWQSLKSVEHHLLEGKNTTNYYAAFSEAVEYINADIDRSDVNVVSNTTYIVLFLTDGIPDDGGIGQNNQPDPYAFWPDPVAFPYPGLQGCIVDPHDPQYANYLCPSGYASSINPINYVGTPFYQVAGKYYVGAYGDKVYSEIYDRSSTATSVFRLIEKTRDPAESSLFFHKVENNVVYEPVVRFNTYYYNVQPGSNGRLHAQQDLAKQLLRDIAEKGNGTFIDLMNQNFSFVNNVDLNPADRQFTLNGFFVENKNAVILSDLEVAPDSDSDGLYDDQEIELGTNPFVADTDGDGLRDGIEHLKTSYNPLIFDIDCSLATSDEDHDGLNKCEEAQIMTDETLFDSDHDGMPDGVEVIYGLNPNKDDRNDDNDFDEVNNFNEVMMHRNPNVPDDENIKTKKHMYSFKIKAYQGSSLSNCYHIEIENLEIVKTPDNQNEITISYTLIPEDKPQERGFYSKAKVNIDFSQIREGISTQSFRLEDLNFELF